MASKTTKIKGKAGRPKMKNVAREPSGRVSRSGISHPPADIVALNARARRMGLTVEQARDQKAGTFIGALNIIGKVGGLSDDQYEGATRFLELRSSYLVAIKAPSADRDSNNFGMPSETISEGYEDWCKSVTEKYADCKKAIQTAQNELRQNLWAALDFCVIKGERHPHMIGDLRVVCNVLARFFGV
ncbi:hypothetical protein [Agrobacterium cavarae]|uniref:hypothetical protein n=1 Tax=Agrobacterium cavarae TaxID=2528239 RepID=UPI000DDE4A6B|nr:hypothetical protein [Agrobacterium cavarae]